MSDSILKNKYIAMNGSLGVGKTTQSRMLAEYPESSLLLGKESEQPEIISGEVFTQGSDIEAEKWFLHHHIGKLALFPSVPPEGLVSDMSVENDLVFGRALLKGKMLEEFE
ncbi:hypothetical protein BH23PAT2_BH23PAT2_01580 [soil metagenome]